MQRNTLILLGALLLALFVYYFSGQQEGKGTQALAAKVEQQLSQLKQALDTKELPNALILATYAEQFKTLKPELSKVADTMLSNTTSKGPAITQMEAELDKIKQSSNNGNNGELTKALETLTQASTEQSYSLFLLNNINVLADLSGGKLSRINPPPGSEMTPQSALASQVVGNPEYGHWVNRNGMSLWEWYGAYAMLRDFMGARSFYNNGYGYGGAFSNYYNNSHYYGSSPASTANDNRRTLKSYDNSGRRSSSYFSGSRGSSSGYSSGRRSSSFRSSRRK